MGAVCIHILLAIGVTKHGLFLYIDRSHKVCSSSRIHTVGIPSPTDTNLRTNESKTNYRVSPSVYAIVVSFTASNGCSQVGIALDTFTASFAPDELATITWAPGYTNTNSYTDVPCGPPGFDGHGRSYQPKFFAPHALFDQIGGAGYAGCWFPPWDDPSIRLVADNGIINGPNLPPKAKPRRQKRAEIQARTHTTMAVHSVDSGPINGPNPPLIRRAAAAAQGAPQPPAQTPDPA